LKQETEAQLNSFNQLETNINKKLDSFDSKINICQEIIRGIATLVKMKKNSGTLQQRNRKRSYYS
jgi:hypothetical protein